MKKGVIFGISLLIVIISIFQFASAVSDYCINPIVTDISPSSVGIDKEFTVGILLDNCGNFQPKTISMELIDVSPDIYVQEPLIRNIADTGFVGDRFLLYHMKTSTDIKPGSYYINYRVRYSGTGDASFLKEGNFSVDVIGDEAKLNIASAKTDPVIPREGDTVELTLRIENFGDGDANSIKIEAEHPFEGVKESFIGTLQSEEDGPAIFTFIADEKGEYEFPVNIYYEDDFGEHQTEMGLKLVVLRKKTEWFSILLIALILIAIIAFIFYYLKTKEDKEKIIEQILTKNHNNIEVKKEKKKSSRKK